MKSLLRWFLCVTSYFVIISPAAAQFRILPLGDSVTSSYAPYSSYRYWLWHLLTGRGYSVDFVGQRWGVDGGTPARTDFDQNHEGHPGWQANDGMREAGSIASATQPDIVLLDLGGNDIEQGQDSQSTVGEIQGIIHAFRRVNPRVIVVVAIPTPVRINQQEFARFRRSLARMIRLENRRESRVVGVNLSAGFNPARYTYDGVHPNEQGERWIAKRYYKKLAGILRALTR